MHWFGDQTSGVTERYFFLSATLIVSLSSSAMQVIRFPFGIPGTWSFNKSRAWRWFYQKILLPKNHCGSRLRREAETVNDTRKRSLLRLCWYSYCAGRQTEVVFPNWRFGKQEGPVIMAALLKEWGWIGKFQHLVSIPFCGNQREAKSGQQFTFFWRKWKLASLSIPN